MTPSDYSQGNSLEHDRMQADVLEAIHAIHQRTDGILRRKFRGADRQLKMHMVQAEFPLEIKNSIRGFVDILQRWQEVDEQGAFEWNPGKLTCYTAYEIKPKITTVGGLIRQMRAEAFLIGQWHELLSEGDRPYIVSTIPVVRHDDPELALLRRLWTGPVLRWNREEKTLG